MVEIDAIYTGPGMNKTREPAVDRIINEIMDEVGDADNIKEIVKRYTQRSREDPELADVNAETACRYAWVRLTKRIRRLSPRGRKATRARAAEVSKEAEKMTTAFKAVLVMELILPNGKRVRDCTFAELKAVGGLFMRLASKGKPNQIVGKVLTDQQAQALWKGAG